MAAPPPPLAAGAAVWTDKGDGDQLLLATLSPLLGGGYAHTLTALGRPGADPPSRGRRGRERRPPSQGPLPPGVAEVWDENWSGSTKTLDVTVAGLRRRLAEADDASVSPGSPPRITTLGGHCYRPEP